ncbi:hypothetical protein ANN_14917, partial [Periplaneta americana]
MADLCEGGNEPPGSLKASNHIQKRAAYSPRPQDELDVVAVFAFHRLGRGLDQRPGRVTVVVPEPACRPPVHETADLVVSSTALCEKISYSVQVTTILQ